MMYLNVMVTVTTAFYTLGIFAVENMSKLTKWKIILGNIFFAVGIGYFYFKTDAPPLMRKTAYVLLLIALIVGAINDYKARKNESKN